MGGGVGGESGRRGTRRQWEERVGGSRRRVGGGEGGESGRRGRRRW